MSGFTKGFSLGLTERPNFGSRTWKRYPAKPQLRSKIADEVAQGRILGPFDKPPIKNLVLSPVCAIPKPNGKSRLIFNLSSPKNFSVNDNIPQSARKVNYCNVTDVALFLLDNDELNHAFMAKIDLTDAYRLVPIQKDDWRYLGMAVGDELYVDRCLPMGAASSCQIFQRISNALAWIASSTSPVKIKIFNYIDDFLILAYTEQDCRMALAHLITMLTQLGIPVSPSKTIEPTQNITFLGIGISSVTKTFFVPQDKASKTLLELEKFLKLSCPRVKEWQRILGKLTHIAQVVYSGRVYLSSVYAALKGTLSLEGHKRRELGYEAREDLHVWRHFLMSPPNKHFKMVRPTDPPLFTIDTDAAASHGFGCLFENKWFAGIWPAENWKGSPIAFLELYPIFLALHLWEDLFEESLVRIRTDNIALVTVLNKLYSKDKYLRQLLKPIAQLCLTKNIQILACHIPGTLNIGPDLLSRGHQKEFLTRFPHAEKLPQAIPPHLQPNKLLLPLCCRSTN